MGEIITWKIASQAPIEAAALGTGRRIVANNFNESDLISTRLFCMPNITFFDNGNLWFSQ